ncbi:MAG TPA: prepilin-type N-terminal cleavage/methylation domain-containing protein [Candidatus Binataceae bacterium]|nr:prepilin-type N-terminal cleavage/methylation domain-containing protein [Candidatus Binataceae bacterium]
MLDSRSKPGWPPRGFTLLEVMVAMAVLGLAMLGLLGLHHQSLKSVIRGQEVSRAAMLAQAVLAQAELEQFPQLGATNGDFSSLYPGEYPNFRWQRIVEASSTFPDVRKVRVFVFYGPQRTESFTLTEFMHNPVPLPQAP